MYHSTLVLTVWVHYKFTSSLLMFYVYIQSFKYLSTTKSNKLYEITHWRHSVFTHKNTAYRLEQLRPTFGHVTVLLQTTYLQNKNTLSSRSHFDQLIMSLISIDCLYFHRFSLQFLN